MAVGLEQVREYMEAAIGLLARQGPGAREIADQEPGPRPGEQGREGPAGVVEQEQGTPHLDGADRGQVAAEDDRRRVPRQVDALRKRVRELEREQGKKTTRKRSTAKRTAAK